jgi:hypothetical protein
MAREFEPTPEMIPDKDFRFTPERRLEQLVQVSLRVHDYPLRQNRFQACDDIAQLNLLEHHQRSFEEINYNPEHKRYLLQENSHALNTLKETMQERRRFLVGYNDQCHIFFPDVHKWEDVFIKGSNPIMKPDDFYVTIYATTSRERLKREQKLLPQSKK